MNAETLAIVISLVVPFFTGATVIGGMKVFSRHVEQELKEIKETLGRFGSRLGELEQEIAVLRDREPRQRRATRSNKAGE